MVPIMFVIASSFLVSFCMILVLLPVFIFWYAQLGNNGSVICIQAGSKCESIAVVEERVQYVLSVKATRIK